MQKIPPRDLSLEDKQIVIGGIFFVSAMGWMYLFYMAWAMENMHLVDMWMPPSDTDFTWKTWDFFMLFMMWMTMMLAMMTPTATSMIMMFATVNRQKKLNHQPYAPTFIFLSGYLLAWAIFSIAATVFQWLLHQNGLMNPMMNNLNYLLSGAILVIAGIYQWTPLKDFCLSKCRSPLTFILTSWKDGEFGAFKMGFHHGIFCVGCCWALMAILFAVGVMNMLWVVLITIFVLLEKILPFTSGAMRAVTGLMLVIWGSYWLTLYSW